MENKTNLLFKSGKFDFLCAENMTFQFQTSKINTFKWLLNGVLVFCFFNNIFSQTAYEHGFEVRQKLGFLAAHRGVMAHLPNSTAKAVELSYYLRTRGEKQWHNAYRFPTVGATLFVGSVGNNELLGRYMGFYGFAELPLIQHNRFELNWKFSVGGGYAGKTYDPLLNPKSNAISSKLNAMICLGVKGIYRFKSHGITLGLDLTHFSNASFKVPNYGINLPYLSVGYVKRISPEIEAKNRGLTHQQFKKWQFGVSGFLSLKESMPVGGGKSLVVSSSVFARNFFKQRGGLETSLDIISNQEINNYEPLVEKSQFSIIQLGIYTGYLIPFDRFHFVLGMGAYIRDVYKTNTPVYHRLGCRYQFDNGLLLSMNLKTHFARADYFEYGIGYTFKTKKR